MILVVWFDCMIEDLTKLEMTTKDMSFSFTNYNYNASGTKWHPTKRASS